MSAENAKLERIASSRSASDQCRHGDLELAKWIAIIAMTIDHYGKIVDPSLYAATNDVGRVTFPLLAWIIGTRLAMQPVLARSYLGNLVLWALISQPVFVIVGKGWAEPNILVTLALGTAAHYALQCWRDGTRARVTLALVAITVISLRVDYGVFGVLTIPLVSSMGASAGRNGSWAAGPLGVLANLSIRAPYFGPGGFWALAASPIAVASLRLRLRLPRLPKQAFYAYYPLHLLALHALAGLLR